MSPSQNPTGTGGLNLPPSPPSHDDKEDEKPKNRFSIIPVIIGALCGLVGIILLGHLIASIPGIQGSGQLSFGSGLLIAIAIFVISLILIWLPIKRLLSQTGQGKPTHSGEIQLKKPGQSTGTTPPPPQPEEKKSRHWGKWIGIGIAVLVLLWLGITFWPVATKPIIYTGFSSDIREDSRSRAPIDREKFRGESFVVNAGDEGYREPIILPTAPEWKWMEYTAEGPAATEPNCWYAFRPTNDVQGTGPIPCKAIRNFGTIHSLRIQGSKGLRIRFSIPPELVKMPFGAAGRNYCKGGVGYSPITQSDIVDSRYIPLELQSHCLMRFELPKEGDWQVQWHKSDPGPVQRWVACENANSSAVALHFFGETENNILDCTYGPERALYLKGNDGEILDFVRTDKKIEKK